MTDNKPEAKQKILYTIKKNDQSQICISVVEYDGLLYGDLRVFAARLEGPPVATQKGIRFNIEKLPEIINGLQGLKQAVDDFLEKEKPTEQTPTEEVKS